MKAVLYKKSVPRYLLVRGLGQRFPGLATGPFAPLAFTEVPEPALPTGRWARVRPRLCGICGSDLATIQAKGSAYFSAMTSFPFVLGHEVVGEVVAVGPEVTRVAAGDRVALAPVLGCAVRGLDPCAACLRGQPGNCERVTQGPLAAGIQTGFCRDTGGGMTAGTFVAHELQLHRVPPAIPDEAAVLIEPWSCALHAVLLAPITADSTVLVLGSGTMGLLVIAGLRALASRARILAVARYPHQARLAQALGADELLPGRSTAELDEAVARATGATILRPELGRVVFQGGADVTFDCVGSASTIDDALRYTRARGTMVLVGMPAIPRGIDWTAIW
ncbi:MAG TPA: alcohol dehydrogenase catalytic domain-containing protein, partial [Candidatus Udaeobacter sp.]|nr:alcohol dehydrogenase catalytic domain-containing protein [Candidatus Udaeobacter sp.]